MPAYTPSGPQPVRQPGPPTAMQLRQQALSLVASGWSPEDATAFVQQNGLAMPEGGRTRPSQPYGNDNIMGSVKPPSPVTLPRRTERTELPPRPTEPKPVPTAGPKPSSEPWWKSNIRRRTQGTLRSSATTPRRYNEGGQVMANGRFPLPSAAQIAAMSPEQKMQQGPQLLSNIRMGLRPASYYNMPGSVREGMSSMVSALGQPPEDFYQGLEQGYPGGVNPAQGITAGFNRGGKVKFKKNADGSTEFSSD